MTFETTTTSNKVIFWTIIFIAIAGVGLIWMVAIGYQTLNEQAKATIVAIPTVTAAALEFNYQTGLGNMNIGRWPEAKVSLDLVFAVDPNYKDVQAKLKEVEAQIVLLSITPTPLPQPTQLSPTPTPLPVVLPASFDKVVPEEELIAYYPFEGNANDESGNKNQGREYGGVNYGSGKIGQAAFFDGIDDYILITPQSDVSAVKDFTISAWVYLEDWKAQSNSNIDRQYIFDGHTHSNTVSSDFYRQGFFLIYDGNSEMEEIHNGIHYHLPEALLEQNIRVPIKKQWHFIVFMRRDKEDYTYVDGQLISNLTYYRTYSYKSNEPLDMRHNWFVGTFSGNNPHYGSGLNYSFHGVIDELRIYNYALSSTEIEALYH
jgi:hypothetical protein